MSFVEAVGWLGLLVSLCILAGIMMAPVWWFLSWLQGWVLEWIRAKMFKDDPESKP